MPNWSYNNLNISGSPEKMKEFYDIALKPNSNGEISFRFSNIFPMPEKIQNTISPSSSAKGRKWMNENVSVIRDNTISNVLGEEEYTSELIPVENNTDEKCKLLKDQYGADNWYDWNLATYGTKWDCEVLEKNCIKDETFFECQFDTAWSPPGAFLYNAQKKFPDLTINLKYQLEGSDECGVFYTDKFDSEVTISHETDEVTYVGIDGRDIYYSDEDGEWHYHDDNSICEDYITVSPFE